MNEVMESAKEAISKLDKSEVTAFRAWFRGGNSFITKYANRDSVFMGKAECEWVDFNKVWIGKFVELGLFTARVEKEGTALGAIGKPKYIKYELRPTELGFDAYDVLMGK